MPASSGAPPPPAAAAAASSSTSSSSSSSDPAGLRENVRWLKKSDGYNEKKYYHWLPKQPLDADADASALGSTTLADYKEFDGLIHATHVSAAANIFNGGSIEPRPVADFSVLTDRNHSAVWWAPITSLGADSWFGNVVFHIGMTGSEVSNTLTCALPSSCRTYRFSCIL